MFYSHLTCISRPALGISKGLATAVLTPLVLALVWLLVRRIRRSMEH